jgi:aspartate racemase
VTPSYWRNCSQVLANAAPEKRMHLLGNKLRLILSASEMLWSDIPEHWTYSLGHGAQIINMLGQTEVTGIVATYPVALKRDEPLHVIPAGRPISNARIYLLDQHMQPVPVGLPGELYVGGEGLGRGYLNRPNLTAERFVPNPFVTEDHSPQSTAYRLYRTGDLARYRADGVIEFLGRSDHQVKIRGFRIEPGEVEAVLGQHPAIREVVAMAAAIEQNGAGQASEDQQLIAYIVADLSAIPTPGDLRAFMKKQLPDYMIPSAFIFMEAFPLTSTGKVDRSALPHADASHFGLDKTGYAPPRNPVEEVLVRIWADLLSVERVGIHDNFFELGGHSLLAIQSMAYLQEMLGVEEPLIALFFEDPTVAGVAGALMHSQGGQSGMEEIAATLNQIASMSDDEVDAMLTELGDDDIAAESNTFGAAG